MTRMEQEIAEMTPARLDHLKRIAEGREAKPGTNAGHGARKRGLTEWSWRCSDGVKRTESLFRVARSKDPELRLVRTEGERLTRLGGVVYTLLLNRKDK